MFSNILLQTKYLSNVIGLTRFVVLPSDGLIAQTFRMKSDDCRKALVDIPKKPTCPSERKEKKGILHKIKLKVIEGGTNFGSRCSFFTL